MKKTKLDVFPSYAKVLKAKQDCYSKLEIITITDSSAEVTLQSLLDPTAKRIVESQQRVLKMPEDGLSNLILIGKWGFHGSSGQSEYKQRISG